MKPWMLYTRVSTEDQAQGASLEAQEAACRAMALARGWTVGEAITEAGASGKSMERQGARRMIEAIKAKAVAGVIAWKLDRLTRSLRDLIELVQLCDANGVALVSVTESIDTSGPMGRFTVHLLGAIAQLERETISQRTKLGMAHRRAQGAHTGGHTPAGLTVETRDGLRVLAVHPEHGAKVRRLWPMVIEGASIMDCARFLTQHGVPTLRGGAWNIGSISQMLANPRYRGLLVDADTQERVQSVLADRMSPGNRRRGRIGRPVARPSDRVWRLHGIANCARCGAALVGCHGRGSKGVSYAYLRCSGRMKRGGCTAPPLRAEVYEESVIRRVREALSQSNGLRAEVLRVAAEAQSRSAVEQGKREALVLQRDAVQRKIDVALDAASEPNASARAWSGRISALQIELERVSVALAEVDGKLAAASLTADECEVYVTRAIKDLEQLGDLSFEDQQKHLRAWVRQVRLSPEVIEADLYLPALVGQVCTDRCMWLPTGDGLLTWTRQWQVTRRRGKAGRWEIESTQPKSL